MIPGAPPQARWLRPAPRRSLTAADLSIIIAAALPRARLLNAEPLSGGLRNSNFKLHLDGPPGTVVLRIYEHHPSLCQKEIDVMRLVGRAVPAPEVIYAAPSPREAGALPPFTITQWIEGVTFLEVKRSRNSDALIEAAQAAGTVLAEIGRFRFPKPGWLEPGPIVGAPLLSGADPFPRFVDLCLASAHLQSRVAAELRDKIHRLVWSHAAAYAAVDHDSRLVHGDFNKRNLMLRLAAGKWQVAAVLDWEFAVSASPLADIGSFLRYERTAQPLLEPHFSAAFERAGGSLPPDWRHLSRLLNLAAVCESLTHESLPADIAAELVELARAFSVSPEPP